MNKLVPSIRSYDCKAMIIFCFTAITKSNELDEKKIMKIGKNKNAGIGEIPKFCIFHIMILTFFTIITFVMLFHHFCNIFIKLDSIWSNLGGPRVALYNVIGITQNRSEQILYVAFSLFILYSALAACFCALFIQRRFWWKVF